MNQEFQIDADENLAVAKELIAEFEDFKESLKPSSQVFKEIMHETGSQPNIKVAEGYEEITVNYAERADEILSSLYAMKEEAQRIKDATE